MPCYHDERSDAQKEVGERSTPKYVHYLESCLCALINAIERRVDAKEIMLEAATNGKIDILEFWLRHRKIDESRLMSDLIKRYSRDEIDIIKTFFKGSGD